METRVPPGLGKCTERKALLVSAAVASAWTQTDLVSKKPSVAGMPCQLAGNQLPRAPQPG